jgi:hypothetical protein
MIQTKELTDTLLTAYLDFTGLAVTPRTNGDGKHISFEITGENLDEAIQHYYLNPKVPILNFCSSYKKIRSMIFNLKGGLR